MQCASESQRQKQCDGIQTNYLWHPDISDGFSDVQIFVVFAVTRTERDTYSRSVRGMNESSLKLNFRPETLVPSQPHRPGAYPAMW